MITKQQLLADIRAMIERALVDKGSPMQQVSEDTVLLGSSLGIDSLDLAAIVVQLSDATGHDPFKTGFVEFRTVSELIGLYSGNGAQ
jgi:acyl carrier protein